MDLPEKSTFAIIGRRIGNRGGSPPRPEVPTFAPVRNRSNGRAVVVDLEVARFPVLREGMDREQVQPGDGHNEDAVLDVKGPPGLAPHVAVPDVDHAVAEVDVTIFVLEWSTERSI